MSDMALIAGTDQGLWRLKIDVASDTFRVASKHPNAEAEMVIRADAVEGVQRSASVKSIVYAGTRGDGAYATSDGGRTWTKIHDAGPYGIARSFLRLSATELLVGTEPAALYRIDGDRSDELPTFRDVEGASEWYTPYSEHAGAVHALTRYRDRPETLFAAIEVGGVLRSDDRGASWRTYSQGVHPDVHEVIADPHRPGRLYAATAGGVYRRDEEEPVWTLLTSDLDGRYIRTVFLDPEQPDRLLAPISHTVGGPVRLYSSGDAGGTWRLTTLAEGSWQRDFGFVNRIAVHPENARLLAVVTEPGQVFLSRNRGESWSKLDQDLGCRAWGAV